MIENSHPSKRNSGRRDLRSQKTRANLRHAAGKLIMSKGLANTTVNEIAAAAGVSKGTFYLHFNSKEDLILEYADARLRHVVAILPELLLMSSVRDSLYKAVQVVIKGKDWHPEFVKLALLKIAESYDQLRAHDLRNLFLPLIELGIGRGELRTDIQAPILASFVADTIYCCLRNWGMGLMGDDLDKVIDHSVTLAYDGIRKR